MKPHYHPKNGVMVKAGHLVPVCVRTLSDYIHPVQIGWAPDNLSVLEVATRSHVPPDKLVHGKLYGSGPGSQHRRWILTADISLPRQSWRPRFYRTGVSHLSRDDLERWVGEGRNYSDIADMVGLTRERVRQKAEEFGVLADTSRSRARERRNHMAALMRAGMSRSEAGNAAHVPVSQRPKVARDAGFNERDRRAAERVAQMAPYVERVRSGESINGAADGDRALAARIWYACKRAGVRSLHESGNPNYRRPGQ